MLTKTMPLCVQAIKDTRELLIQYGGYQPVLLQTVKMMYIPVVSFPACWSAEKSYEPHPGRRNSG
jgi:hypothetical protein